MSFEENILNYWQFFVLAPVSFVSAKIYSLNSKVAVHDTKINSLEASLNKLCEKHDETNNLLRELNGIVKNILKNN